MYERVALGRLIVVKTKRKSNGAVGSGRKNNTGKVGTIYQLDERGNKTELAQRAGTTFRELSKKLHATGFIPRDVAINSRGKTEF